MPVFIFTYVIETFDPVHNRSRMNARIPPERKALRDIKVNILGMEVPLVTHAIIIVKAVIMARALTQSQRILFFL